MFFKNLDISDFISLKMPRRKQKKINSISQQQHYQSTIIQKLFYGHSATNLK
jgi:hypothetical protein